MDEDERELTVIMEYFKSLREEIYLRVAEHTRLVWIKVFGLGAAIAFSVTVINATSVRSPLQHYFVWIIPLAAVIFDMLIASNLRDVNNIGHYVRDYMEGKAFRKYVHLEGFRFWEECVAQAQRDYHCYTCADVLVIWLLTVASTAFGVALRWQTGLNLQLDVPLSVLALVGLYVAYKCLRDSLTLERVFLYPELGNVPRLEWQRVSWWSRLRTRMNRRVSRR